MQGERANLHHLIPFETQIQEFVFQCCCRIQQSLLDVWRGNNYGSHLKFYFFDNNNYYYKDTIIDFYNTNKNCIYTHLTNHGRVHFIWYIQKLLYNYLYTLHAYIFICFISLIIIFILSILIYSLILNSTDLHHFYCTINITSINTILNCLFYIHFTGKLFLSTCFTNCTQKPLIPTCTLSNCIKSHLDRKFTARRIPLKPSQQLSFNCDTITHVALLTFVIFIVACQPVESVSPNNRHTHDLFNHFKQLTTNMHVLTTQEQHIWNYLIDKIEYAYVNRTLKKLQKNTILEIDKIRPSQPQFSSHFDSVHHKRNYYIQQTPDHMFQMHRRHTNDWHNFGQLDRIYWLHPEHPHHHADQYHVWTDQVNSKQHMNRKYLGPVTAIRYHKHIDTEEVSNSWQSNNKNPSYQNASKPSSHIVKMHKLVFQLGELPSDEHLIAASLRIRYEPPPHAQSNLSFLTTNENLSCPQGHVLHWPLSLWLYTDQRLMSNQTTASFEPDDLGCQLIKNPHNTSLVYLPKGWFHIPLDQYTMDLLSHVNRHTARNKQIILQIGSIIHKSDNDWLEFARLKRNRPIRHERWLNKAPHLLTYHRNAQLIGHLRRSRRSANLQSNLHESTVHYNHHHQHHHRADRHNNGILKYASNKRHRHRIPSTIKNQFTKPKSRMSVGTIKKPRLRRRAHYQNYSKHKSGQYQHHNYDTVSVNPTGQYNQADHLKWKPNNEYRNYGSVDAYSYTNSMHVAHYVDRTCQRRELIINFNTVGWGGWVIAPQAYNARYCFGQCPFPLSTHYNTTNHAVLLQLVHLLDVAQIPGPCCVPNELSPQSLLYHSHNGDVVLKVYEDMIVESCACR